MVTYNKVVGSKGVVVDSSVVVEIRVLVVNMGDLNVINLLYAIVRFLQQHLILLYLLLCQHQPLSKSETMQPPVKKSLEK